MYPAFLNMFIKVARHDQRGTANSSILISWDVGVGVGMLAGGVLAEYAGYAAAFWTAAAIQAGGAAMFILRTRGFSYAAVCIKIASRRAFVRVVGSKEVSF